MRKKNKKWMSFRQFKYIYTRVPRLTVEVIVKTNGGIILSKRSIPPKKGRWHIPGGTVLFGETLAEAVRRVAREELGVLVRIEKLLGVIEYRRGSGFGWPIGIAFLVRVISGKLRPNADAEEVKAFRSFPDSLLGEQKLFLSRHLR